MTNEDQIIATLEVAFKNMFPELAGELATNEKVREWLAGSLVGIVEFTGTLPQETRKQRDNRMQCHKVYDGDFKQLAGMLRNTYPNTRNLSPQELILKTWNGISSIKDVLGTDGQTETPTVQKTEEDSTTNTLDSNRVVDQTDSQTVAASVDEPTADVAPVEVAETVEEVSTDVVTEQNVQTDSKVIVETGDEGKDVTSNQNDPIGTVKPEQNESANEGVKYDKTTSTDQIPVETEKLILEDNTMENMAEELLAKASSAASTMAGDATPAAPAASNITVGDAEKAEAKEKVMDALEGSLEQRIEWTKNNTVDQIIVLKQPNALRAKSTMGTISVAKDQTVSQKVEGQIQAFIKACSGKAVITKDEFDALPDEQKYAMVIAADAGRKADDKKATNLSKAKKVYELLQKMAASAADDKAQYPAFINTQNVSYAWKGVIIGGQPMNRDALIVTIIDKSTSIIIGAGSDISDTKNRVEFKLGQTKVGAANKITGVSAGSNRAEKKFVVSISNKASFTDDASHISYMMTKEKGTAKASFGAEIVPDGFGPCAASFSYNTGEVKGKDKDGNTTYKKKTFSVRVSVDVTDYEKELDGRFKLDGMNQTKLDNYWGVKFAPSKQADLANPTDFAGTALAAALSAYFIGTTGFEGKEESTVVASLKQIKKAAEAETADELAQ